MPSGIECTPRQLQCTRDRYPHSARRSEDAANAFPCLLRGSVLLGHRILQARIRAIPEPTDTHLRILALSEKSVRIYSVYRATPNQQWVNVGGTLVCLLASGACVQGGIVDASDFAIPWTMLVVHPMRTLDPGHLNAVAVADDLYTEVLNDRDDFADLEALCRQSAELAAAADAHYRADPSDLLLAADAHRATHIAAAVAAVHTAHLAADHPIAVPADLVALATAAHMFISLAADVGIAANTAKVRTDQDAAAAGTPFDLQPHLHLFPRNPKPTTALPAILPLTRNGFKAVGAWVGPGPACNEHAETAVRRLHSKVAPLLDPRIACGLQVICSLIRACYLMQSAIVHLQRSMVPSHIRPAMQLAMQLQHNVIATLFHVPRDALPATLAEGASHPSLAIYRLHLTTNLSGAAFPNPILSNGPAHAGATISAQPIMLLNPFHRDLAADPTLWPSSGVPHFSESATVLTALCSTPAFYADPPRYADRHRAFRTALCPEGAFALAAVSEAAKLHPQSCLTSIQNHTIIADILADDAVPVLTRASIRQGLAFNAGRALVPFYLTRDNRLSTDVLRTLMQTVLGVGLSFISASSRCVGPCKEYGPRSNLTIPGAFGPHHISLDWHRAGCHQISCRVGSGATGKNALGSLKARHDAFHLAVLDGLAAGGAAIDRNEIWVSRHDNKRADGALYHTLLSTRGIAIDTTIWNDLTPARLNISATISHWALLAAEATKNNKYTALCEAVNLDFAAYAANPRGGFGPTLERHWRLVWTDALTRATAAGLPTRPIASLERRHLERIAATMARHLHHVIWTHTSDKTMTAPPNPDPDLQVQMPSAL